MTFYRISQLEVGDKFLYNGTWRRVVKKDEEVITFTNIRIDDTNGNKGRVGVRSQQFVQVEREPLNSNT